MSIHALCSSRVNNLVFFGRGRLSRDGWQLKEDRRTLAGYALRPRGAAVRFNERLDDRKSQAAPTAGGIARAIHAIKALKDMGQILGIDADPCIADPRNQPRTLYPGAQRNVDRKSVV